MATTHVRAAAVLLGAAAAALLLGTAAALAVVAEPSAARTPSGPRPERAREPAVDAAVRVPRDRARAARVGSPVAEAESERSAEETTVVVSGRVLDDLGDPVPGAIVMGPRRIRADCYSSWMWVRECDIEGRFSATVPAQDVSRYRDGPLLSDVLADGFLPTSLEARPEDWAALRDGGRIDDLVVVLRRAAAVEGEVRDRRGLPVPFARVDHWTGSAHAPPDSWHPHVWTDRRGRFRIEGLDPRERHALAAHSSGWRSGGVPFGSLLSGGHTARLEVFLSEADPGAEEAQWELGGRVVDDRGLPLEGVEVRGPCFGRAPGSGHAAVTDSDGRFTGILRSAAAEYAPGRELEGVRSGEPAVTWSLDDALIARLAAEGSVTDLVLAVRREGALPNPREDGGRR